MKRFRNYVLMAAGFVVLVIVVGAFSAGPVIAQAIRAALVSNVDDPGRIPYEVRGLCNHLSTTSFCSASQPVPAGKRLVSTHVAGFVRENCRAAFRSKRLLSARAASIISLLHSKAPPLG